MLPRRGHCPSPRAGDGGRDASVLGALPDGAAWVSVAFYLWGLILGIAHQPVLDAGKRHLRSAAGEASLRLHRRRSACSAAASGAGYHRAIIEEVGADQSAALVSAVRSCMCLPRHRRHRPRRGNSRRRERRGRRRGARRRLARAFELLRESKHLQIIALVIGFAALAPPSSTSS